VACFLSREQVNKELREKFDEDKGAKRMQRSELVLKKFGLLDQDFHLRPFLLTLLTEQIAGFYDNKKKDDESAELGEDRGAETGDGA